jgi:hypothetical protein
LLDTITAACVAGQTADRCSGINRCAIQSRWKSV